MKGPTLFDENGYDCYPCLFLQVITTFKLQGLGGEHQDNYDYSRQSLAGALQIVRVYEDENAGSISNRLVENTVMHAPKVHLNYVFKHCIACS